MKFAKVEISLAAASRRYAELRQKRDELARRRSELWERRVALSDRYRDTAIGETTAHSSRGIRPAVLELLGKFGDRFQPAPEPQKPSISEELRSVEVEIQDVDQALDLLAQALREARTEASRIIADRIRPEHDRRAAALAEAMVAVGQRTAEYFELLDVLNAEDVAPGFLNVLPEPATGDPRRAGSGLALFLNRAIEAGVIGRPDVPGGWKI